jgi:hypothetical protein
LGISLQQFYDTYTPRTLHNHVNGYHDHQTDQVQQLWEIARWQLVPLLNIQLPKNKGFKSLQQFTLFPWEEIPPPEPKPNLSKKEEREKLKQTFNK